MLSLVDTGMVYFRQLGSNFWYEFDNFFLWDERQDVLNAFGDISDLDRIFKEHKINGTYPLDFINEVKQDEQRVNSVVFLGQKQLDIINKIFGNDIESEQRAFEDFGQGLLYDDRSPRPVNNRVHMMDEGQFGFYRWHTFIRTAVLLNQDPQGWLHVDRHVGLACAIDSIQHPSQSTNDGNNPNNSEISTEMLDKLRSSWLHLSFEELDCEFDKQFS
jgi:hypothetical protein